MNTKTRTSANTTQVKSHHVHNDKIIEVISIVRERVIKFSDILDNCKVESEQEFYFDVFDYDDGYSFKWIRNFDDSLRESYLFYNAGHYQYGLFEINKKAFKNELEFYRNKGASKQVAFELTQRSFRNRINYAQRIFSGDEGFYTVSCEYLDHFNSLGFCDDTVIEETKEEMALHVARELEDEGYIIEGKPTPKNQHDQKIERFKDTLKRNLNLFTLGVKK